nr:cell filamentation protein Fic [bacterium]
MDKSSQKISEIIIYKDQNGPEIEVSLEGETVWLAQHQIAALFGVNIPAINKHIRNIFNEGEL